MRNLFRRLKKAMSAGYTATVPPICTSVRDHSDWTPELQQQAAETFARLAREAREKRLAMDETDPFVELTALRAALRSSGLDPDDPIQFRAWQAIVSLEDWARRAQKELAK